MDNIPTALKAFVIAGGLVLVAGTIVLAVLIALRPGESGPVLPQAPHPTARYSWGMVSESPKSQPTVSSSVIVGS